MAGMQPVVDTSCDGHVHTRLCRHATGEMEEYVQAALACGLQKMVFLEHLEAGIAYHDRTWLTKEDFRAYLQEGERLRRCYSDRIEIGIGIELGYNPRCKDELLARACSRRWDRIGLSCHFLPIGDTGQHLNLLSRKSENIEIARRLGVASLLSAYFTTLQEAVATIPATVLCHLDAALRHVPEVRYTSHHFQQIETLLTMVKEHNMALEVNTSGLDLRGEVFPAQPILALAVERDIPLLAGSDAHRPADVGRHFSRLPEILTSAACPSPPRETWR